MPLEVPRLCATQIHYIILHLCQNSMTNKIFPVTGPLRRSLVLPFSPPQVEVPEPPLSPDCMELSRIFCFITNCKLPYAVYTVCPEKEKPEIMATTLPNPNCSKSALMLDITNNLQRLLRVIVTVEVHFSYSYFLNAVYN